MGARNSHSEIDLDVDLLVDVDFLGVPRLSGGEPRRDECTGVRALMLAVLEDGIRSFLSPMKRVRAEAERWVYRQQRSLFSFVVVCETLGLEPGAVRRALERLRQRNTQVIRRSRPNVRRAGRMIRRRIS